MRRGRGRGRGEGRGGERGERREERSQSSNRESRNYNNKAAPPLDTMMVPSQENFTHDVSLPFA